MRSGALSCWPRRSSARWPSATAQAQSPRTVKPVAPRPALGGDHRQAARRHRRRADVREGRQRRGRRLRDARRRPARCGTRSAGAARRRPSSTTRARRRSIGVNALGVAPTGRDAGVLQGEGASRYPPEYGPLAAVTPGTPGGLITMLAECGRLSLKDVLAPAIQMADGYPIEAQLANALEREKKRLSRLAVLEGGVPPPPRRGARGAGRRARCSCRRTSRPRCASSSRRSSRRSPPARAARRRSRPPTTASTRATSPRSSCAGTQEQGGLFTKEDLARWQVKLEEPVKTSYKGIDVYKLTVWTQGPAMLQALNILENADLKAMGYNSPRYIHTALPGDEPGLRRPRLLLRRPGVPARGAGRGAALEGVREAALRADARGPQRSRRAARRPLSRSRAARTRSRPSSTRGTRVPGETTGTPGARPRRRR